MKWIQAIRRDEGKDFEISDSTKVCSRHFRNEDLKKTLAGKMSKTWRHTFDISLDSHVASQEETTGRKERLRTSGVDFRCF